MPRTTLQAALSRKGRRWQVDSLTAKQQNVERDAEGYWHFVDLRWTDDVPFFQCDCKGYQYNKRCSHIRRVRSKLDTEEQFTNLLETLHPGVERDATVGSPIKSQETFRPSTLDTTTIPSLDDLLAD